MVKIKLGDIIDFKNGKSVKKSDGVIPIYGGNGILGYTDKSNFSHTIVVGRVGAYCGSIYVEENSCWVSDNAIAGVPKEGQDLTYLYYVLKSLNLNSKQIGSSQPLITQSMLRDMVVDIEINIEKQKRIANSISIIDQKIQINNQINQELEAMAKTLYDYWFVQFDFPDQNGEPYKSSGGKMVYHPELKREIPEGWGVARLDQLQIATGKRDANFGTENGKYNFWTTANSPIKADEFSFEGKAILIAGNGNFYVNFTDGKFEAYQRTYVIQSEDENMLIFMYMACLQSVEKLRKGSNGSIIKYITIGDVNNIASPYNKKVVDEFVRIYSPLIDLISKNKRQNQELTKLRDWLLPMLMNGQVKVE